MGQFWDMGFRGPKKTCDICGLWFYKEDLSLNKGKWVCDQCNDEDEDDGD